MQPDASLVHQRHATDPRASCPEVVRAERAFIVCPRPGRTYPRCSGRPASVATRLRAADRSPDVIVRIDRPASVTMPRKKIASFGNVKHDTNLTRFDLLPADKPIVDDHCPVTTDDHTEGSVSFLILTFHPDLDTFVRLSCHNRCGFPVLA